MSQDEPETHSFIIKFWIEKELDGEVRVWRGGITHVSQQKEGSRRYFHRLEDIAEFIAPYLASALPATGRKTGRRGWRFWRKE